MTTTRFSVFVGIILGLVWVFSSFESMLLVGLLAFIGWFCGRFIRIDLNKIVTKIQQMLAND